MNQPVSIPGYSLLRTLGTGGMATVYLATQESLDREVALKVMAPALAANSDFCEQFIKEGRITAKLTHPHLMTVHDIGSHQGVYYLASEYLPAGTLRERLSDEMSIADALDIARDIASGLNYAHDKGFVHRDVKPGNIMFRSNGSAVLADFGIAKAIKSISSSTMAGNAIGTPDYMSPEQAQASPVDGRSDLYSLGAVLFEMLTGRKPYRANDAYAVALMHITEPVPQLPDHLAWLQSLIDGLMAKNPEQRFANGNAFIAACDALIHSHPLPVIPGSATRTQRKRASSSTNYSSGGSTGSAAWQGNMRLLIPLAAILALLLGGWIVWRALLPSVPAKPEIVEIPAAQNQVAEGTLETPPSSDPVIAAGLDKLSTEAMLARAEQYTTLGISRGDGQRLSFPAGDSAIDLYHEVQKRDASNQRASEGLAKIATFFADGAQEAAKRGLYSGALGLTEKGLMAAPSDQTLIQLKADLEKKSTEQGG